jgi:hypothetical protein
MEPEELSSHGSPRVLILSIVSLIVIVIAIGWIVMFARNRVREARNYAKSERLQDEVSNQNQTVTGVLGLSLKGTNTTYRAGQTVTLFVYADSKQSEITGYDAVLSYDTKKVRFESVKSVLDGMDIYETEDVMEDGTAELIITGIQSLSAPKPFVFNNTALAEVTFVVLDSGPIDVSLVYEPGSQRESNLVTTHNQDILSSVVGARLNETR